MKSTLVPIFLFAVVYTAIGQKSITINIEKLKEPSETLRVESYRTILENLIQLDDDKKKIVDEPSERHSKQQFNIVAESATPGKLVNFAYHPFFEGMYHAYAEHRPFTLSPDMIWLLICQGFSQHVNNNSASLRHMFVDFNGKITLIVRDDRIDLNNPNSPWQAVFPEFAKKISDNVGKQLTETLTADFSTTTLTSKMASQITLMDAFKSYFEFVVLKASCGIPKVTLEGTKEDWQEVLTKTEALRKYNLDWWVDKMEPVLKKILAASGGEIDIPFWMSMFKYHQGMPCGLPGKVDGWIVKFFPYNKQGTRNDLESVSLYDDLPNEMVKVDLEHDQEDRAGNIIKTPLELWAGFVGLQQNDKTFQLKPEIGWMIRRKSKIPDDILTKKFKSENKGISGDYLTTGIVIRVKTIPDELLHIGPIHSLTVFFTGDIQIPEELTRIKIGRLAVFGKIDDNGKSKLRKQFPDTELIIRPFQE